MAAGFPLATDHVQARTAEALYQACRFPDHPTLQSAILRAPDPVSAKAISREYTQLTRADWDLARFAFMRWCLALKLAVHFESFGSVLASTRGRTIVEVSNRDDVWSAHPTSRGQFVGTNALGRLLMKLRKRHASSSRELLLVVRPPRAPRRLLLGEEISTFDARERLEPGHECVARRP